MEGGSQQATSSDDGQFTIALRQMMKEEIQVMVKKEIQLMCNKEIQLMVIHTVEQVIRPIVENLIRKVVKEEIHSAQEKFLTGRNRSVENEATVSKERSLCLKFQDQVSLPVLTGKVIKGKGGTPIKVALVDKITGQVVDCGPESCSKVEILVLEAKDDDNDDNWSREDFNNRIIREGDKEKPHFAKSNYIYLKKGIGTLCNTKLGHDSTWMKNCKCRLGARMENFGSIEVQEALTESFMVSDSRSKLYGKHYPPSLSDQVWRLDNIGKDGTPYKRLNEKKILNVRDFLFLHNIDPKTLQQIVGVRHRAKIWNETINHAQTCIIDDKRMYVYYPLSESKWGVVFDVVGQLEGAIHDSHYVPNSDLSEAEQDCARKLLLSAFEYRNNIIPFHNENAFGNQNNIITFDDENALLQQFPQGPSCVGASTNVVIPEGPHNYDPSAFERINGHDYTETGNLCDIIRSPIRLSGHPNNVYDFRSANMGQLYDPGSGVPNQSPSCLSPVENAPLQQFSQGPSYVGASTNFFIPEGPCNYDPYAFEISNGYDHTETGNLCDIVRSPIRLSGHPNNVYDFGSANMGQLYDPGSGVPNQSPSYPFRYMDHPSANFDYNSLRPLPPPERNDNSETPMANSHSHRQSKACSIQLVGVASLIMLWRGRARRRVMALGGIHVTKRQRI